MEQWYRVSTFGTDIVIYDVVKTTEKTLTYLERNTNGKVVERRVNKKSDYSIWFPDRNDAVTFLRDKLTRSIKYHEQQIEAEKKKLERLA